MALILAVGVAACGDDSSDSSPNSSNPTGTSATAGEIPSAPEGDGEFKLGTQPWIGYGPFTLADHEGIFEAEGLNVTTTNFKEDRQINAAFASKRLDGLNAGTIQALSFAQAGLGLKIVLIQDVSGDADAILAGPDIKSFEDLKGKAVAYEEGTTGEVLLRYALQEHGMTIDDIKKVPLAATEAGPAIISGRVDAAYTYEPFVTTALNSHKGIHAVYTAAEKPGIISDALVVREEVIDEYPGRVAAMVRAWQGGLDFYSSNTEEAQAIIAEDLGTAEDELADAFDGITFYDANDNAEKLEGEFIETIRVVADIAKEAGLLTGDIDVESLVDARFAAAVAEG